MNIKEGHIAAGMLQGMEGFVAGLKFADLCRGAWIERTSRPNAKGSSSTAMMCISSPPSYIAHHNTNNHENQYFYRGQMYVAGDSVSELS